MHLSECFRCTTFPCQDVFHERYTLPQLDLDPENVFIVLISECAAAQPGDDYYASGSPLFASTTIQAFQDAGAPVNSIQEVLDLGVYLTTAVKCAKTGYGIKTETIDNCSRLLEQELALFPNLKAYLLMGDVAKKSLNLIAKRNREPRPVPPGSTYKIRGQAYTFRGGRVFPSYLQAGPSFFIEKSKRRMIAEDIAAALNL